MTPEDEVKELLSNWLRQNDCRVYWEKKNENNHPIFKTKYNNKPDLLISGNYNTAVEVKIGNSKSNVYNGVIQCLKYWKEYVEGNIFYINNKPTQIHNFVLATGNVKNGHLYPREYEVPITPQKFSYYREDATIKGELPLMEWSMTEQSIRLIWRLAKEYSSTELGIGGLLSTALDSDPQKKPMLQVTQGRDQLWTIP